MIPRDPIEVARQGACMQQKASGKLKVTSAHPEVMQAVRVAMNDIELTCMMKTAATARVQVFVDEIHNSWSTVLLASNPPRRSSKRRSRLWHAFKVEGDCSLHEPSLKKQGN